MDLRLDGLTQPIAGIESLAAQEVFEIMVHRILEATPTGDAQNGWLPLNSAPKDGTDVDLFGFIKEHMAEPSRIADAHYSEGQWLFWAGDGPDDNWLPVFRPLLWRHIPAAPKKFLFLVE